MTRKVLVTREIQEREEKVKMIDSWTFEDEEIFDSEDEKELGGGDMGGDLMETSGKERPRDKYPTSPTSMKMLNNVKFLSVNISKAQILNRRLRKCCGWADPEANPDMDGVVVMSKRTQWFRSMRIYETQVNTENAEMIEQLSQGSRSGKFIEDILAEYEILATVSSIAPVRSLHTQSKSMQSALNRAKMAAFRQQHAQHSTSARVQRKEPTTTGTTTGRGRGTALDTIQAPVHLQNKPPHALYTGHRPPVINTLMGGRERVGITDAVSPKAEGNQEQGLEGSLFSISPTHT